MNKVLLALGLSVAVISMAQAQADDSRRFKAESIHGDLPGVDYSVVFTDTATGCQYVILSSKETGSRAVGFAISTFKLDNTCVKQAQD